MALLLLCGLALVAWMGAVLLPFDVFRRARRNAIRLDGSRSERRARRELRHAAHFLGNAAFPVVAFAATVGGGLVLLHRFVAPIPLLGAVVREFRADAGAWEAAIEVGARGDLGAEHEAWANRQGFSYETSRFWQETLWDHWPTLALLALAGGVFLYWFLAHYYAEAVGRYAAGVRRRARAYREADEEARNAVAA